MDPANGVDRTSFERAQQGRLQVSMDGEIIAVNGAAARMLGYVSTDALLEAVPSTYLLHCDVETHSAVLFDLEDSGIVADLECEWFHADGGSIWVRLTAWTVFDLERKPVGYEGFFIDVTSRRLVEATARAVSSSLHPVEAMTAFADALASIVPFGILTLTVIEGETCRRIFHHGPRSPLDQDSWILAGSVIERVVETREPLIVENTRDTKWPLDEELAAAGFASYVVLPLVESHDEVVATINLGFSAPNSPTASLLDLLRSVADAIAQGVQNALLFESQRNALEELRTRGTAQNEFIATVSHDLRSPMTAVTGFAEVLNSQWADLTEERKRRFVDLLHRTAKQLQQFVDEVLQVSHLASGKLTYEIVPCDVRTLIDDVITASAAPEDSVVVDVPEGLPKMYGDRVRCWQVLSNLLGNARKFAPPDAPIEVWARATAHRVTVSVRDRGPGVPADLLESVFESFSQGHSSHRSEGAGLGLYICKQMIEAQGGEIHVESREGEGATFSFSLPRVPSRDEIRIS